MALTFTGEKTYYVVGDEVPELEEHMMLGLFSQVYQKARSFTGEEIFAEGLF